MSAPLLRGWCPGAHRPMLSGDGLVVRLRPRRATLSAAQAGGVAALAARYGSGFLELTNRANLQLRGVAEGALPALIGALGDLDLLDADPAAEARRNIVVAPTWADPAGQTVQAALALERGLAHQGAPALPGKFGFAVDTHAGRRHLAGISADIRIEAALAGGLMVRADGAERGRAVGDAEEAATLALELAAWFLSSGGVGADGRGRMRAHLRAGAVLPAALAGDALPAPEAPPYQPGPWRGGLGVSFAFGQISAGALAWLAARAGQPLRLTPWRAVFLPGIGALPGAHPDLILQAHDPLLRLTACAGAPGCPQARGETRDLARRLAAFVPPGRHLHVSGCAKGCAHPGAADLAVVATASGYAMVAEGRAGDAPFAQGLAPEHLPGAVAAHFAGAR